MISEPPHVAGARAFITRLASGGRHHFTSQEAQSALGVSPAAARLALNRLSRQGLVASPARGFYLIVPPEYRRLGCLPAEQFIPALMEHLDLRYYAGLLSAAQYHGAAHHRPQAFQVVLARARRPLRCGTVHVQFFKRAHLADVPVQSRNTPRGTILVSTVEATTVDLVGYAQRVGGLDQVATVLAELAEQIDGDRLAAAAASAPVPWAQRLGYLLELLGGGVSRTGPLKAYVQKAARDATPLVPGAPRKTARRVPDWKLLVNATVEAEA